MITLKRVLAFKHVTLFVLLLLTACGGSGSTVPSNGDVSENVEPKSQGPSVKIVSPVTGDTIKGDTIEVKFEFVGFTMDREAIGKARESGKGHWHLLLDGRQVTIDAGETSTLQRVPPGPHNVRISLRNNDHSTLSPEVDDNINIDVVAGE